MIATDVERFFRKVNLNGPVIIETPCWEFIGRRDTYGYGQIGIDDRVENAHRFAFIMVNGPIKPGLLIRHRCDYPPCVNPAHLLDGTNKDNADDRIRHGKSRKGMKIRHVTHAERAEIFEMAQTKMPRREIAKKFGLCLKTVQRYAKAINRQITAEEKK
jgi:hypothetical protein